MTVKPTSSGLLGGERPSTGKICIHCMGSIYADERYYERAATQFGGQGHEHVSCYRVARENREIGARKT